MLSIQSDEDLWRNAEKLEADLAQMMTTSLVNGTINWAQFKSSLGRVLETSIKSLLTPIVRYNCCDFIIDFQLKLLIHFFS